MDNWEKVTSQQTSLNQQLKMRVFFILFILMCIILVVYLAYSRKRKHVREIKGLPFKVKGLPFKVKLSPSDNSMVVRESYLIIGYIQGTLTEEELDELNEWVAESDDNMKLFEELTNLPPE